MGRDLAGSCRQQDADELIMGLTEREARSALLMLAYATTSLGDDDADTDAGLNATQAAIAEDAARMAIRAVLAQTRGIAAPAPAAEVPAGARRAVKPTRSSEPRGLPDIIA